MSRSSQASEEEEEGLGARSEEEQLSEGEQAGEVTAEGSGAADAAGPAATAAADAAAEQPESRPASQATDASEETVSETDFTVLRHEPPAARAAQAAREGAAPPPALTEAALAASPFVELRHPVTLYEGLKLLLMAPVVLLKVIHGRGVLQSLMPGTLPGAHPAMPARAPAASMPLGRPSNHATLPTTGIPLSSCWCLRWLCPMPGPSWPSC